jgi:hypothetical protein
MCRSVYSSTTGSAKGELRNDHKRIESRSGPSRRPGPGLQGAFGVVLFVGTVAWIAKFPISISI